MQHEAQEDRRGRRIVRIRVSGRVQGVGFRFWIEREALVRGVEGWVRNCRDGSVEAVFAGDPDAVASMVETCALGPAQARVSGVTVEDGQEADIDHRRSPGSSIDVLPDA